MACVLLRAHARRCRSKIVGNEQELAKRFAIRCCRARAAWPHERGEGSIDRFNAVRWQRVERSGSITTTVSNQAGSQFDFGRSEQGRHAGLIAEDALPRSQRRRLWVCAVERRRFPVGVSPTRQPLQPEATGAAMEVTKWLKPSDSVSRYTVTARVCRP